MTTNDEIPVFVKSKTKLTIRQVIEATLAHAVAVAARYQTASPLKKSLAEITPEDVAASMKSSTTLTQQKE